MWTEGLERVRLDGPLRWLIVKVPEFDPCTSHGRVPASESSIRLLYLSGFSRETEPIE